MLDTCRYDIAQNGGYRTILLPLRVISYIPDVRSKVCMAPIVMRSKYADFAPHIEGSNADFAPDMEGNNVDFTPHMERRHSFRDQKKTKIAISTNSQKDFFNHLYDSCL